MSPTYSICPDHGYIAGEKFKCPECGSRTEVYSRITGYYRPVQNWNDGKSQEYRDRKTYNAYAAIKREFAPTDPVVLVTAEPAAPAAGGSVTLFTTTTCPNCRIAKTFLDKAGIAYDVVVADQEVEKAREYDINQAPTLVIGNGAGAEKRAGLAEIRRYIDGQ